MGEWPTYMRGAHRAPHTAHRENRGPSGNRERALADRPRRLRNGNDIAGPERGIRVTATMKACGLSIGHPRTLNSTHSPIGQWRGSWRDERILSCLGGCVLSGIAGVAPSWGARNSIDDGTTTGQIRHEIRVVGKFDTASRAVWYLRRLKKKKKPSSQRRKVAKDSQRLGANRSNNQETTGTQQVR